MVDKPFPRFSLVDVLPDALRAGDVRLHGVTGAALGKLLADLQPKLDRPLLVVIPDPEAVEDTLTDVAIFGGHAAGFPAWDLLPTETEHPDVEVAAAQVAALRALSGKAYHAGERSAHARTVAAPLVLAPMSALLQPVVPPDALETGHLVVRPGLELPPEAVTARLVEARLEPVAQIDGPGQFARRGGILDVFPLFAEQPVRIEWFGDEIETIRYFDVATQRSGAAVDEEIVLVDVGRNAFRAAFERRQRAGLLDYLPQDALVLLLHPARLTELADLYLSGFSGRKGELFALQDMTRALGRRRLLIVPELEEEEWDEGVWRALDAAQDLDLAARSIERLTGGLDSALRELNLLAGRGARITIFCHNAGERQRLDELLQEKAADLAPRVEMTIGTLSHGFEIRRDGLSGHAPEGPWVVAGEHEIFGRYATRRHVRRRFQGAPLADFTDLKPGDYVVHVANGIARYEGIETLESNDTRQDYLALRFAEDAKLYVPLSHVDLVQRYIGSGEVRPQLSKLGGATWARRKKAAETAARDVAADLLRLQAVRRAMPGEAYPPDDPMQREFEASFPYEETPDQLAAIQAIKQDQERPHPMDRLLCGDVGFGKTEVALRAAFKVVTAGRQAAVLVPTTILAEQHYRTFHERTVDYPVTVESLSRFRSDSEQRRIIEGLKKGAVDIVVGTHRLLSKDVGFKNLGLVIIDEEQRFGVEHKERLKEMRASVDVLTMTATPIPRTLNMALLGLRDISNLTTAPVERQAVRTMVVPYSDEVIRRGILRELARGGQCFFLHNRVQSIGRVHAKLAELVPEARFATAHGQMPEGELLEVMTRFLQQKIDVLICTTIIESGVDIPTVNTLFVDEADHFGLSELHQLRGRVGRYRYQAYAYFLVPGRRVINPVARRRLQALEEYAELGAGFRIALRDLEIRGAGNILGVEQSGHILAVGFDLYCRLLEQAVARLRGEVVEEIEPVELDLGTQAFVPLDYIDADTLRVDFYRRLGAALDLGALENLRSYARERFGPLPQAIERLFVDQTLRNRAAGFGINYLGRIDNALVVGFTEAGRKRHVARLRTLRRKVTPLEAARWRIELAPGEDDLESRLRVIEGILDWLEKKPGAREMAPHDEKPKEHSSGIPQKKGPKIDKVEVRSKGAQREHIRDELRHISQQVNVPQEPKPPSEEETLGARVLDLQPHEHADTLYALIHRDAFDVARFGPVTMTSGTGEEIRRHFLRYTGTGHAPEGQAALALKADSPAEARSVLEDHFALSETRLLRGIVED